MAIFLGLFVFYVYSKGRFDLYKSLAAGALDRAPKPATDKATAQ